MAKKSANDIQKYFPFILAITLSTIGIVKSNQSPRIELDYFLYQFVFFTLLSLSIWFVNLRIQSYKWHLVILANLVLIGIYSTIVHLIFRQPHDSFFYSTLRVLVPTILLLGVLSIVISQKRNQKLIVENLQLKSENYKAELENLKKQLNPHFIFNSLATLQTVIRKDAVIAEEYVLRLSDLYRNILQKESVPHVTLKDELAFVESYVFLQKTRFKNSLAFEIDIKKESLPYSIPTFSLQLLIENCIKHNIVSDKKPLRIVILQRDLASITVSNNVQPKIINQRISGIGLLNLKRRYELMEIDDGVVVEENDKDFSVTLKFF